MLNYLRKPKLSKIRLFFQDKSSTYEKVDHVTPFFFCSKSFGVMF